MKESLSVKKIVAIGIGAAVFVILGRFVVIPTGFPNTNLETTLPFLSLMAVIFGPLVGGLIGLIGHILKDLTFGSLWWSWIVCSGIMGVIYGFAGKKIDLQHGEFSKKEMILFNIYQVVGNIVVWGLIAPTLDVLIYQEPASKVYLQGLIATVLNIILAAIIGTLLMKAYAATRTKKGSLSKE